MLKISIIIPVYKVPLEYLRDCLDSLIVQTMPECEFIIVSDGAPEAECCICEEYAAKDSRFKFFKREHAGVSTARNYGMEQAQGEYIAFLDSDDQLDKNFCKEIYKNASNWNSDIIVFEHTYNKNNKITNYRIYPSNKSLLSQIEKKELLNELFFPKKNYGLILTGVWSKAIKKDFIQEQELKFDSRFCYSEDQLFCLIAFLKTTKISYIAAPLYHQICRINSASFSYKENYETEIINYIDSIKKIFEKNNSILYNNNLYNRTIQCILYTLDKGIFRPDPKLTISKRKKIFNDFLDHPICNDSLLCFEKNKFKFSERILCFFCKYRLFLPLLFISKKWHWDRKRLNFNNHRSPT